MIKMKWKVLIGERSIELKYKILGVILLVIVVTMWVLGLIEMFNGSCPVGYVVYNGSVC